MPREIRNEPGLRIQDVSESFGRSIRGELSFALIIAERILICAPGLTLRDIVESMAILRSAPRQQSVLQVVRQRVGHILKPAGVRHRIGDARQEVMLDRAKLRKLSRIGGIFSSRATFKQVVY